MRLCGWSIPDRSPTQLASSVTAGTVSLSTRRLDALGPVDTARNLVTMGAGAGSGAGVTVGSGVGVGVGVEEDWQAERRRAT